MFFFIVSVGLREAYFGEGTGPIFFDNTACSPRNHNNLVECFDVQSALGRHDCSHSEDASVICSGKLSDSISFYSNPLK